MMDHMRQLIDKEGKVWYLLMGIASTYKSTMIEQVIEANKVSTCRFRDRAEKLTICLSLIFVTAFISLSLGVFHMTEVATNGDSFGEVAVPASLS